MTEHFYHHFYCQKCQGYTVFDGGICTRCSTNKDLGIQPEAEVVVDDVLPEDTESDGGSRGTAK